MKLAATLALALSLPSTALAAPKLKPRTLSPAASAAVARIAARNIPKIVMYAKPKPVDPASIMPSAAAGPANPAVPKVVTPPAATEPVLTTEELAVDVVELTPRSLHSPQVGTQFKGTVETFGDNAGLWVSPKSLLTFGASAQWISGHSLLVECTGYFHSPQRITLSAMQAFEDKAASLGQLTVNLGSDTVAFVVPATQLGGWDRLGITITDTSDGDAARLDKCTFTRL